MNAPNLIPRLSRTVCVAVIGATLTSPVMAQSTFKPTGAAAQPSQPPTAPPPAQRTPTRPEPGESRDAAASPGVPAAQTAPPNSNVANNPAAATNAAVYRSLHENDPALRHVGTVLLALQADIEQALPLVYSLMSGRAAPAASDPASGQATNAISSAVSGQVATPTIPQPARPGQPFLGMIGTNAFAMNAETMRLLYALHNQLQLTLPALRTVNGVPVASRASNQPLPFINRFTALPTPTPVAPLAPTSR